MRNRKSLDFLIFKKVKAYHYYRKILKAEGLSS